MLLQFPKHLDFNCQPLCRTIDLTPLQRVIIIADSLEL